MQGQQNATGLNALLLQQAQLGASQGIRLLVPAGHIAAAAAAAAAAGRPVGSNPAPAPYRGPALNMSMLIKAPVRKTGGSTKSRKHCNCKNSRCLKLYCECFASGRYCDNCNCLNCFNNKESEAVRQSAVESILERNPNAFRPKIQTAEGDTHPQSIRNAPDGSVRHTKGCNCKKSSCLKKYCECFQGGIFCTEICKCVDCKNYDGSEARAQVLTLADPYNHPQQLHQQVAAQQAAAALKRPRMHLQQPLLQQPAASAGLLAQNAALQQLAAAAAAAAAAGTAPAAPAVQLPQMPVSLPPASAPASAPSPAPQAVVQPPASPPQPSLQEEEQQQEQQRPVFLEVVHELVNPLMIEELCQLLILVAKEEADKRQQQQQAGAAAPAAAGGDAVHEGQVTCGVLQDSGSPDGTATGSSGAAAAAAGRDVADLGEPAGKRIKVEPVQDVDNGSTPEPQQQVQVKQEPLEESGLSSSYAMQEAAVLQEFNAILNRIIVQAAKKANSLAAGSTAQVQQQHSAESGSADGAAAAAAATTAAATDSQTCIRAGSLTNGVAEDSKQPEQQLQQVPAATQPAKQASAHQAAVAAAAAQQGGGVNLQQQLRGQFAALPGSNLGVQLQGLPLSMLQQVSPQSLMLAGLTPVTAAVAASQPLVMQQQVASLGVSLAQPATVGGTSGVPAGGAAAGGSLLSLLSAVELPSALPATGQPPTTSEVGRGQVVQQHGHGEVTVGNPDNRTS